MKLQIHKSAGGVLVASLSIWNGTEFELVTGQPKWGPGPIKEMLEKVAEAANTTFAAHAADHPLGTLCGLPVMVMREGFRSKGFQELFYETHSAN